VFFRDAPDEDHVRSLVLVDPSGYLRKALLRHTVFEIPLAFGVGFLLLNLLDPFKLRTLMSVKHVSPPLIQRGCRY